jgi:hypothetical protein
MAKKDVIAQLEALDVTFDATNTEAQLKEILRIELAKSDDSDSDEEATFTFMTLSRKSIRAIKERGVEMAFSNPASKTAIKHGTYNTYSFEGVVNGKLESLAFAAWEDKFITNFNNSELYAVDLKGTVTGNTVAKDEYGNPAHPEILWEVLATTTRKEHAQDRMDTKEDAEDARIERMEILEKSVFNKDNFASNPELIKSSGFLEMMNASVGA